MMDPEEYHLDGYGYYCPICGSVQTGRKGLVRCNHCLNMVYLKRTIHEWDYYKNKAIELNDPTKYLGVVIREIILREEASKGAEFSMEAHELEIPWEEHFKIFEAEMRKNEQTVQYQPRIPRCPTCGSANIEKISFASKAFGATMFGLLSKTATSQFKCRNCGYKW